MSEFMGNVAIGTGASFVKDAYFAFGGGYLARQSTDRDLSSSEVG